MILNIRLILFIHNLNSLLFLNMIISCNFITHLAKSFLINWFITNNLLEFFSFNFKQNRFSLANRGDISASLENKLNFTKALIYFIIENNLLRIICIKLLNSALINNIQFTIILILFFINNITIIIKLFFHLPRHFKSAFFRQIIF